jgi:hypothetical protein
MAMAYDSAGNVGTSPSVSIQVNNAIPLVQPSLAVAITAPVENATLNQTAQLVANVTAVNTTVQRVEFYDGAALLGTAVSAPYQYSWDLSNVQNGPHTLTAKAFPMTGASAVSPDRHVNVSANIEIPNVNLTQPAKNAYLRQFVQLAANVSGAVVNSVNFYLDNKSTLIGSAASAPYTAGLNTLNKSDGPHTLFATAVDASNNATDSTDIAVTIDNTLPTVAISAPTLNQNVAGLVTVSGNAFDTNLSNVVMLVDGAATGNPISSDPYSWSWDSRTVSNGAHSVALRATDLAGNQRATDDVSITVNNAAIDTVPPTVSVVSPSNGSTVSDQIQITAVADDNIGGTIGVKRVDVFIDDAFLRSMTLDQISGRWNAGMWDTTSVANGSHTVILKAFDAAGNMGISPAVTLNVLNDNRPVAVSFVQPTPGLTDDATINMKIAYQGRVTRVGFYVNGVSVNTTSLLSTEVTYIIPPGMADGRYTLTADVYGPDNKFAEANEDITLDRTLPVVSNFNIHLQQILQGQYTVSANASDLHFKDMTLYAGAQIITTVTTPDLSTSLNTTTMADGPYQFKLTASDAAGNKSDSTVAAYIDNLPPDYHRNLPVEGTHTTRGSVVPVEAIVTDAGAGVHDVSIMIDNQYGPFQMTQANSAGPYRFSNWQTDSNSALGAHPFTIVATDIAGHQITDHGTIFLDANTTPPTVTITAPANNANLSGLSTPVSSEASDTVEVTRQDYSITGPNFYSFANSQSGPHGSFQWSIADLPTGDYTIRVKAYDAENNTADATPVTVHLVNDSLPPTVRITSPAYGSTLSAGTPFDITVDASDNVGVTQVLIYAGQINTLYKVAERTAGPWTFHLDPAGLDGTAQTYRAVAYDASGNHTTSEPVIVRFSGTQTLQVRFDPSELRNGWAYSANPQILHPVWSGLPSGTGPIFCALFLDNSQVATLSGTTPIPLYWNNFTEGLHRVRFEGAYGAGTISSDALSVYRDKDGSLPNRPPNTEVQAPAMNTALSGLNYAGARIYAHNARVPYGTPVYAMLNDAMAGSAPNYGNATDTVPIKTTIFPNGTYRFAGKSIAADYLDQISVTDSFPVQVTNKMRIASPYDGQRFTIAAPNAEPWIDVPLSATIYEASMTKIEFYSIAYDGSEHLLSKQTVTDGQTAYGCTVRVYRNEVATYTGIRAKAYRGDSEAATDFRYISIIALMTNSFGKARGVDPVRPVGTLSSATDGDVATNVTDMTPENAAAIARAADEQLSAHPETITPYQLAVVSADGANAVKAERRDGAGNMSALPPMDGAGAALGSFSWPSFGTETSPLLVNPAGLRATPDNLQLMRVTESGQTPVALNWCGPVAFADIAPGNYILTATPPSAEANSSKNTPLVVRVKSNPSPQPELRMEGNASFHVMIYNLAGQLVKEARLDPTALDGGVQGALYPITSLKSDLYMARVAMGDQHETVKVMVVK